VCVFGEKIVVTCAESLSTSRGPNRTRFLTVQVTIRDKMQCDKKSLIPVADTSKIRNTMGVGGHQTILTKNVGVR
jgi:hypothetical protein